MTRKRSFAQVDVFSPHPGLGNPVAVVLDAEDLDDEGMQRFARWTNLSETTFVLPPSSAEADYRLRIFTPGGELPFAGHPTLGSAHAWLEAGGLSASPNALVQECGVGLVELRREGDTWSFAAPPTLRQGELEERYVEELVAALGIERDSVLAHQWVDNGPGWAVLRLPTAEAVLALEPDLSQMPKAMLGVIGEWPPGSSYAIEVRAFAPAMGLAEDPITGSLNAAVAQWLLRTGAVQGDYRASQGRRLGRAGEVAVTVAPDGGVWVGGATSTLVSGTVLL
jgi:PhzF family phenazine biosynthesis protein